jgi:hypothetical protein
VHDITIEAELEFTPIDAANTLFMVRTTAKGLPYICHVDKSKGQCSGARTLCNPNGCIHLDTVSQEKEVSPTPLVTIDIPIEFIRSSFLTKLEQDDILRIQVEVYLYDTSFELIIFLRETAK